MDGKTYQISERIKLLTHQATLLPPPRDLAIEEIKEQAERHERQRRPHVAQLARRARHVSHGREDGQDAAQAVELGDQVREVQCADEAEVPGLLAEERCLLVDYGAVAVAVDYWGGRLAEVMHGEVKMVYTLRRVGEESTH